MKAVTTKVLSVVMNVLALASAAQAEQVSGLTAFHREGQTFLTWKEADSPVKGEALSVPVHRALLKEWSPKIAYRVYRSDNPIDSVQGLQSVGETGPLSCWHNVYSQSRNFSEKDLVSRYVIVEGQTPLSPGTGLYVHNPQGAGERRGYYAVTVVTDGKEDITLGAGNLLKDPVAEKQGQGVPVLQSVKTVPELNYARVEPELRHYIRWEAPPHANHENQANDILVAIPKQRAKPAPVGLHLHGWGGSYNRGWGWWINAEKGAILIAANQDPYDWWTGHHEFFGKGRRSQEAWQKGVVRPYTQTRLLSLVDWAATQWDIDRSRVFAAGGSMGGSGSLMLALRHPEKIAWAIGTVGVRIPHLSPQFKNSYAQVYGEPAWGVKFEDGTPVWDYFNDAWYLRQYPARETPFVTWSNGKNDGAIGWPQAVEFYKAMQETKRPHLFVWGQKGHRQPAAMPKEGGGRVMPIDIHIDQSLPAFTRCSLDGNPGNGDPKDGDPEGSVNSWLYWETTNIVDAAAAWEMTVALAPKAPKDECTVDLTPRRLQAFKVKAGATFKWTNTNGGREVQSGVVTADANGLVTIEGLNVTKSGSRVRLAGDRL